MAGRGRGRGGRGPAVIPFTDEETGKRVTLDVDAPPPLFPARDQPPVPEPDELERKDVACQSKLQVKSQRALPYYLRSATAFVRSHAARAEPSGAAVLANGKCDSTLEDVMTLWPGCTPEELYCRKQRRQSERPASAQPFGAKDKDLGADFFERFDRLDKAAGEKEEDGEGPAVGADGGPATREGDRRGDAGAPRKPGAGGEEEEEEDGEREDEEEAGFEDDDDYLQGVQYDDDEGYEDTLDDGGDEGPTY